MPQCVCRHLVATSTPHRSSGSRTPIVLWLPDGTRRTTARATLLPSLSAVKPTIHVQFVRVVLASSECVFVGQWALLSYLRESKIRATKHMPTSERCKCPRHPTSCTARHLITPTATTPPSYIYGVFSSRSIQVYLSKTKGKVKS